MTKRFFLIVVIVGLTLKINAQLLSESNLPILSIKTKSTILDEPKVDGTLEVRSSGNLLNYLSEKPTATYLVGVELRGSTSQGFPKKPYGVETRLADGNNNNVSILGFPVDNDWVLNAEYSDKTLIRNFLIYNLSNKMGRYASRTKLVELMVNDSYVGVYCLAEKVKQGTSRVNVSKLKTTEISGDDLTGGYIIKVDKTTGNRTYEWSTSNNPTGYRQLYQLEYPSLADLQPIQSTYIKNFINNFETRVYANDYVTATNNYKSLIDLNSFIDFFLLNEVAKNVDGYRISTYMHKDKDSKGGKLTMGPVWDFNIAVGNADYCEGNRTDGWMVNFNQICPNDGLKVPGYWSRIVADPEFSRLAKARWKDLRATHFKTSTIHKFIDSTASVIRDAQFRNFTKWTIMGKYVWPNPFVGQNYNQEIDYLKSWLEKRLTWMDNSDLLFSGVLANEPLAHNRVTVFPNPIREFFSIDNSLDYKNAIFELKGLNGKNIARLNPTYLTDKINFERPNIPSGIYILQIQTATKGIQYAKLSLQ